MLPLCLCLFGFAMLPERLWGWLQSDEASALVPDRETLGDISHRLAMAFDLSLIVYGLACFRTTRPRAFSTASAAFVALLGPVLALEACPSFVTTHRAVLLATLPPFCALLVTLAPIFVRIRAPPPPSTAYGRGAPLAAAEGAGRDGVGEEVEAESSGYDTHDDSDRDW